MTLFRANDRHPVDPRILIIKDMDEFNLWRERAKLGIHGIVCDYPAPMETLQEAAQHIARVFPGTSNTFSYPYGSAEETRLILENHGIVGDAQDILVRLSDIFVNTADLETLPQNSSNRLRIDSAYPDDFHIHHETLAFAFSQMGMICRTGGKDETGHEYPIKVGQVAYIDDTIWHKAPQWDASWEDNPRINLVM